MLLKNICLFSCVFVVVLLSQDAEGQICTNQKREIVSHIQPYALTYQEVYEDDCWGVKCNKTRNVVKIYDRTVTILRWVNESICCEGYIKDETKINFLSCKPVCIPSCTNGYCESPGQCACDDGYESTDEPHHCSPICEDGCQNAICTAPETCSCNFGYILNGTCQPICTEPCINGTCTFPDTCECNNGYRKSESNKCEPYCSRGCSNGSCIKPEVCVCNEGYKRVDGQCIPHCNYCGNGKCIAPNMCECQPGFRAINFDETICAPVCRNCEGTCIKPNLCICDSEYDARNETADGKECDCFDNCTDDMNTCDRTVCLSKVRTTPRNSVSSTTVIELQSSTNTKLGLREEFGDFYNYTSALDDNKLHENRVKNNSMNDIGDATSNDTFKNNTNENKSDNNIDSRRNKDENNNGIPLFWICIAVAILTIVIILVLVLVLKRNEVANFFGKGSYVVKDKTAEVCAPTTPIDTRFSLLLNLYENHN